MTVWTSEARGPDCELRSGDEVQFSQFRRCEHELPVEIAGGKRHVSCRARCDGGDPVCACCGRFLCARHNELREVGALDRRVWINAHESKHGWKQVHSSDEVFAYWTAAQARMPEHQRDARGRVEGVSPVAEEVMLAEALAVVWGEDDERVFRQAALIELGEEPPQLLVHE